MISDSTSYAAIDGNDYLLDSDMVRSGKSLMDYLMGDDDGYSYYPELAQRKDFFQAFQNQLEAKGSEVVWPQVAADTSSKLQAVNSWYCKGICDGASQWVDMVGTTIMKNEWGKFQSVYNAPALTGGDAAKWDTDMLKGEQSMLQPLYDNLDSKGGLDEKIIYFGGLKNTGKNIFNLENRMKYGQEKLDESSGQK